MRKLWPILILLILVVWAGRSLFKYEVYYTQDFKHHLIRSYDAVITLRAGHFPLRWGGIMNYECGVPMFNFYNPLLYYLAAFTYPLTNSLILSIKLISFLSLFIGSLFFYLWFWELSRDRWIALGSSILFLYAPYTLLLIYVRGSPEYLAYAIAPAVFYFFTRAFKEKSKFRFRLFLFLASFTGGLLAISHNVVFMLVLPIILIFTLIKLYFHKFRQWLMVAFSLISVVGFGAFFIFPAIIEKQYTKLDTPIFNYQHHFPTLPQIINSKWGYGDSAIGTADDAMSFQLGYAQWFVLVTVVTWLVFVLVRRISRQKPVQKLLIKIIWVLTFLLIALLSLFLILPWSLPIWQKIKLLQEIQFSWRILGISVFALSALFAFWLQKIESKTFQRFMVIVVVALALIGNRNHLLSQPVYEGDLPLYRGLNKISDRRRFLSANAETILAPGAKLSCYLTTPIASTNNDRDKVDFEELSRGSTYGTVRMNIDKNKLLGDKLIFNLGYFPKIFDFKINEISSKYLDCSGLVCVNLNALVEGVNVISWKVKQTPIEQFFNFVSLAFIAAWILLLFPVRSKK